VIFAKSACRCKLTPRNWSVNFRKILKLCRKSVAPFELLTDRVAIHRKTMKFLSLITALSFGVVVASAVPKATDLQSPAKQFVIFFYETPDGFASRTAAKSTSYWKSWTSYIGSLQASGKMESGAALLPPANSTESDSKGTRQVSSKGIHLSGYVVVKAATLGDATEIAKKSPAIASGGKVEVREVLPMAQHKGGAE